MDLSASLLNFHRFSDE